MEELWAVKDKLAREADYDTDRFSENLREWAEEHPHPGRVIRNPEELRQFVAEEESKREESGLILKEKQPGQN
ncbi:MAG: hypothetical protein H0X66_08550 [Verrucomicrobia bacterium]|nr:hypothetical protein [Verrucomicrobiota bacterium]